MSSARLILTAAADSAYFNHVCFAADDDYTARRERNPSAIDHHVLSSNQRSRRHVVG